MSDKKSISTFTRQLTLVLIVSVSLFSCGEKEQTKVRLTSAERVKIDTLYTREVKTLRPYLDSLCEANFDAMVARAVDSLLIVRREEELRLRERIPKQLQ